MIGIAVDKAALVRHALASHNCDPGSNPVFTRFSHQKPENIVKVVLLHTILKTVAENLML